MPAEGFHHGNVNFKTEGSNRSSTNAIQVHLTNGIEICSDLEWMCQKCLTKMHYQVHCCPTGYDPGGPGDQNACIHCSILLNKVLPPQHKTAVFILPYNNQV